MLFILRASLDDAYVYDTTDQTVERVTYEQINELYNKGIKTIPTLSAKLKSLIRQMTYTLETKDMIIGQVTKLGKISVVIGYSMQNHWTYVYNKGKLVYKIDETCDAVLLNLGDIDLLTISHGLPSAGADIYSLIKIDKKTGKCKDIYKTLRPKLPEMQKKRLLTYDIAYRREEWWYTARYFCKDVYSSVLTLVDEITGIRYMGNMDKMLVTDKQGERLLSQDKFTTNLNTIKVWFPTYNIDIDQQLQELVNYLTPRGSITAILAATDNTLELNLYRVWNLKTRIPNFLICDILSAYMTYVNISKLKDLAIKCNLCEYIININTDLQWSLLGNDLKKLYSYYTESNGAYSVVYRFDYLVGTGQKHIDW